MDELMEIGDWTDNKTFVLKSDSFTVLPIILRYFSDRIEGLSFGNNMITEIPNWITEFQNLKYLNIVYNPVKDISILANIHTLRDVSFGFNKFKKLSAIESILPNLTKLFIYENKIEDIEVLSNAKNLNDLTINENVSNYDFLHPLQALSTFTFTIYPEQNSFPNLESLLNLVKLDVESNDYKNEVDIKLIQSIGEQISKCKELAILNVHSKIANYIDFSALKILHTVNIYGSGLLAVPTSLFNKESINVLRITDSQLSDIPEEIASLESLCVLDLSNNNIKEFQNSILHMKELTDLDISGNYLNYIPKELALMPRLQKVLYENDNLSSDCLFLYNDLIGVYKILKEQERERIKVGIMEVPEALKNAVQEYLVFFDEYYETISGNKIGFNVSKHQDGLKIEVDLTEGLDISDIQSALAKYTSYLINNKFDTEDAIEVGKLRKEIEFLELKIENKINHFEQSVKIIELENRMLKDDNYFLKGLVTKFADKDNLFVMNQQSYNRTTNAPRLINRNTVTITNNITIEPFREIQDILADSVGDSSELAKAVSEVEAAVASDSRFDIADALSKFANVLKKTVENAHIVLVDAPEVVEKLKGALGAAKMVLKTGAYHEIADMLGKIYHMF